MKDAGQRVSRPLIVAGVIAAVVIVSVELRHRAIVRERGWRTHCQSNLCHISLLLHMYAMDNDGKFPENMDLLRPYGDAPKLFICKSSGRVAGTSLTNVHTWGAYAYVNGHSEASAPSAVQAFCPPANHGGEGGNVLCIDGSVSWADAKYLETLMRTPDFYGRDAATNHVIMWPTNHFP